MHPANDAGVAGKHLSSCWTRATGIDGHRHAVAILHSYSIAVNEPVMLFVRLSNSINLGAGSCREPTRFVFVLLGPMGAEAQLANIARLMSDDEFRYDAGEPVGQYLERRRTGMGHRLYISRGEACTFPEVKLHLYGKPVARPGRKMGHIKALQRAVERVVEAGRAQSPGNSKAVDT